MPADPITDISCFRGGIRICSFGPAFCFRFCYPEYGTSPATQPSNTSPKRTADFNRPASTKSRLALIVILRRMQGPDTTVNACREEQAGPVVPETLFRDCEQNRPRGCAFSFQLSSLATWQMIRLTAAEKTERVRSETLPPFLSSATSLRCMLLPSDFQPIATEARQTSRMQRTWVDTEFRVAVRAYSRPVADRANSQCLSPWNKERPGKTRHFKCQSPALFYSFMKHNHE
jgi:hypothetical protein